MPDPDETSRAERSEMVNIVCRIPDDEEWKRACELLQANGFEVYRSWRHGE